MRILSWLLIIIILSQQAWSDIDPNCYTKGTCMDDSSSGRSSSSNPSTGNAIRLNPAAVPTEKGFGLEAIYYNTAEWSIVQGLGQAGAALSPANSEETFFGPPSIEYNTDYLQRHIDGHKYESQKYTLATAFKLYKNKKSGLSKFDLNLGIMGKHNKYTQRITPGGGVSGSWGPVQFGYSYYADETQLSPDMDASTRPAPSRYNVQTYNIGLFLASVILSYSNLQMKLEDGTLNSTESIWMASLFYRRFILSLANRTEDSIREWYNPQTKALEVKQIKSDNFAGLQYKATQNIMIGAYYNYYLLREGSLSVTLFF